MKIELHDRIALALGLLVLHGGSCSIQADSKLRLGFEALAKTGLVTIHNSPTAGFVDIRIFNFAPRLNGKNERD